MTDNELIRLFLPIINDGLVLRGFTNVSVVQSGQPTQQGINTNPTVYFNKIMGPRYGYTGMSNVWDEENERMVHTEYQYMDATYQVSALVRQSPLNSAQFTAFDIVNTVASILQSERATIILQEAGVGILRIQGIRNPTFVDDKELFEAIPSFDFTLSYRDDTVSEGPIITPPIEARIQGI